MTAKSLLYSFEAPVTVCERLQTLTTFSNITLYKKFKKVYLPECLEFSLILYIKKLIAAKHLKY